MTKPAEVIGNMITTVNDSGQGLTAWEINFMESLTDQFDNSDFISDGQEKTLERIYREKA